MPQPQLFQVARHAGTPQGFGSESAKGMEANANLHLDQKVWLRTEPDRHEFRMKLEPVMDSPLHATGFAILKTSRQHMVNLMQALIQDFRYALRQLRRARDNI